MQRYKEEKLEARPFDFKGSNKSQKRWNKGKERLKKQVVLKRNIWRNILQLMRLSDRSVKWLIIVLTLHKLLLQTCFL